MTISKMTAGDLLRLKFGGSTGQVTIDVQEGKTYVVITEGDEKHIHVVRERRESPALPTKAYWPTRRDCP